jgi:aspartyl protease family protein
MKWIFICLAIGLALLLWNHSSGSTLGMENDDFANLIYLIPIAGLLSVGVLAGKRGGFGKAITQLAIWAVIILGLVTAYSFRDEFSGVSNRVMSNLIPGRATSVTLADGSQQVLLTRARGGHFASTVTVNGTSLSMLIDTGASSVVLSHQDAIRAGIDVDNLNYTITVRTANGSTTAAATRLSEVTLGSITRQNVSALVSRDGAMNGSLLGMSFLSSLQSMQMQGDQLTLVD